MTQIDDPRYVKALSHPLRVRILALLQERTASPRELAQWLGASLGTVAYHVRTLHDVGLIELVDTTQVRGAIAHHYRAIERPPVSDEAWAAAGRRSSSRRRSAPRCRRSTSTRARRPRRAASTAPRRSSAARTCGSTRRAGSRPRRPRDKLLAELRRIEEAAAKRLAKDPQGGSDAALAILLFEAVRLSGQDGDGPAAERKRGRRGKRARD